MSLTQSLQRERSTESPLRRTEEAGVLTPSPKLILVALSFAPLLLFVLLSAPAWLSWPFMAERKQQVLIEVLQKLIDWTRTCVRVR
ncbi:hypothetical protein ABZ590_10230 [Streptomyces hirsutus]|uniref:hypothetical protein n=1 Tax=Streptomyces hirsutus TaxID=35620 RepID=UPI0033E120B0